MWHQTRSSSRFVESIFVFAKYNDLRTVQRTNDLKHVISTVLFPRGNIERATLTSPALGLSNLRKRRVRHDPGQEHERRTGDEFAQRDGDQTCGEIRQVTPVVAATR